MRKVLLGAVLSVAFGLSANGANATTTAPVKHPAKRLACHWVTTGDHTLKLLRTNVEPVKTAGAPADRPVRHVSAPAAPASKSSVREPAARARSLIARADLGHIERQVVQRISLMVGVGY
jgi:hypothetical protein